MDFFEGTAKTEIRYILTSSMLVFLFSRFVWSLSTCAALPSEPSCEAQWPMHFASKIFSITRRHEHVTTTSSVHENCETNFPYKVLNVDCAPSFSQFSAACLVDFPTIYEGEILSTKTRSINGSMLHLFALGFAVQQKAHVCLLCLCGGRRVPRPINMQISPPQEES